jgi:hypothetical protein
LSSLLRTDCKVPEQRRGRQYSGPDRLTPGPLFGLPTHAGDRETGSWTPAVSPGLSVNSSALDRHYDTVPCGRTGRDGSQGCCSSCRRCSCSGSTHAGSPVCCSRTHRGSRAGRLLAHSPWDHSLGENRPTEALRVGMFRMANPILCRSHNSGPLQMASPIGFHHIAKLSCKTMTVIATYPRKFSPSATGEMWALCGCR